MSGYTPTRGELISALVAYRATQGPQTPAEVASSAPPKEIAKFLGEAERGLAEVERAAAEAAWARGFEDHERDLMAHELAEEEIPCIPNPYRKLKEEHDDQS